MESHSALISHFPEEFTPFFAHQDVRDFLEMGDSEGHEYAYGSKQLSGTRRLTISISIAKSAYDGAINSLQGILSQTELKRITDGNTLDNIREFIILARQKCDNKVGKSKMSRCIQVLHHYAQVFDVLSQVHADLTSLLWGSIRWLIQVCNFHSSADKSVELTMSKVSMNYITLLTRISEMLVDIGRNMPRVQLYCRLLPSAHIHRLVSEIYAAIVQFLYESIVFFKKHPFSK
jgi:hypothetical protein